MTGEKNRFNTVEKLWKLDDETLTTPEHDEMVLWLLNKDNIITVFPELAQYREVMKVASEVPILTNTKFIVGYWDVVVSFQEITGYAPVSYPPIPLGFDVKYYIEVKPKIKSFGATLRQLKTYLTYVFLPHCRTFIFTPDMRFKEAFESQGINIINHPLKDNKGVL